MDLVVFSVLHQADVPGLTADQLFVIEILKLVIPVVTGALSIAAAYLAYLKSKEVKHEVGILQDQHATLTSEINGKMTKLIDQTERAAHAEGKAEALEQVARPADVPPVQVVLDPDAVPGGRRKLDPPGRAPTPPADRDPASHLKEGE